MVEKFRNTVDNTPFQRNQVMLLPVVTVRQSFQVNEGKGEKSWAFKQ